MNPKRFERGVSAGLLMVLMVSVIVSTGTVASANVLEDIPTELGDRLGISAGGAAMILAACMLGAVCFALGIARVKFMPMTMVLLVGIVVLYGIGWLNVSIVILSGLLVGGLFATKMATIFG